MRVLVVNCANVLSEGVASLLLRQGGLQVVKSTAGPGHLMTAEIERWQPDVIVLEDGRSSEELAVLLELLKSFHSLRIIVIDAAENRIQIYSKHQITITRGTDLVSAIHPDLLTS